MEKCSVLEQYSTFTERVHRNLKSGMGEEEVKAAVRTECELCIRDQILAEFLSQHMEEIIMSEWWEYDEKEHDKVLGDERYEEGKADGIAEERARSAKERVRSEKEKAVLQERIRQLEAQLAGTQ